MEELRLNLERYRLRFDLFPRDRVAAKGQHVVLFRAHDGRLEITRDFCATMDVKRAPF